MIEILRLPHGTYRGRSMQLFHANRDLATIDTVKDALPEGSAGSYAVENTNAVSIDGHAKPGGPGQKEVRLCTTYRQDA